MRESVAAVAKAEAAYERQCLRVIDRKEGQYGEYKNSDWADVNTLWTAIVTVYRDMREVQGRPIANPRTLVAVHHHANGEVLHYWSDGWVSVERGKHRWDCDRIPQPEEINPALCPSEPNRELSAECHADD